MDCCALEVAAAAGVVEAQDAAAAAASDVQVGHSSIVLVRGVVELLQH